MSSASPFDQAKLLFVGSNFSNVNMQTIYHDTAKQCKNWVFIWSLRNVEPIATFENVFSYILHQLGSVFCWNMKERKSEYLPSINDFLICCRDNNYPKILEYFDKEVFSCFALAHMNSTVALEDALNYGFEYLERNFGKVGTAGGYFYNDFGKEKINALIYKIFESAYRIDKFSLSKLFLSADKFIEVDPKSLKYDITKMKVRGKQYFPNDTQKEEVEKDILSLNYYLLQANIISNLFPSVEIKADSIVYIDRSQSQRNTLFNDMNEYCNFTFTPNTPTGKASKHPLILNFWTASDIWGEIYYLQKGKIGKVHIVIWRDEKCYILNCREEKGELKVSKIEGSKRNGERYTIYNISER